MNKAPTKRPNTTRPSRRSHPFIGMQPVTSACMLVTAASVALAALNANAAAKRRAAHMPAAQAALAAVDTASASADGRYQVGGVISSTASETDDAPVLAAGRWQVQGHMLPWTENDEPANATATADQAPPADLSGDGAITADDLLYLLVQWGGCPPNDPADEPSCPGDLDGDGQVGDADLAQLMSCWVSPDHD